MWAVIKFDRKNLNYLKNQLSLKMGKNCKIYCPKMLVEKSQWLRSFCEELSSWSWKPMRGAKLSKDLLFWFGPATIMTPVCWEIIFFAKILTKFGGNGSMG